MFLLPAAGPAADSAAERLVDIMLLLNLSRCRRSGRETLHEISRKVVNLKKAISRNEQQHPEKTNIS